jgi:peptide/nickel transport system substrate-binding protein
MQVRSGTSRRRRRVAVLATFLSLTLVGAACGGDDDDSTDTTEAETPGTSAPEATDSATSAPDATEPEATDPATSAPEETEPPADDGTPVEGGEAEVLLFSEIGSLDPLRFTGSGGAEAQRAFALYGALVAYNAETATAEPVLAESFTPNADFTAWTLKIKPDIVFSDGTPYDAAAVKANWDREKDPANRSPSFTGLLAVGELTVTDPLTLEIPLTSPNAQFPNTVARAGLNYIASPAAITAGTDMTSQAVGAGPYTLESWTRDDRMIMNANPDWKGSEGPYLEKLTFRVVGDEEQRLDTFNTGDADAFYTSTPDTVDRAMEAVDGAEYTSVEVTTGQTIVFNTAKPPFDDIRMRTAYAQAVDWQGLADAVFGPGSEAPYNFTLEGTDLYTPEAELPPYDPEAAQALIDEYVAEKGGPVVINQLAFQQSLDQARGEFIQTALSQLDNIEFNLTVNDSPTNIGLVLAGDYMVSSWGFPVVAPDPGPYNSAFSQALTNYSKYSNPDVDAALLEARATDDKATQIAAIQRVFTQLAKDIPYYPYVKTRNGFVTSPELHGAVVYEDGILRTDLIWKDG